MSVETKLREICDAKDARIKELEATIDAWQEEYNEMGYKLHKAEERIAELEEEVDEALSLSEQDQ